MSVASSSKTRSARTSMAHSQESTPSTSSLWDLATPQVDFNQSDVSDSDDDEDWTPPAPRPTSGSSLSDTDDTDEEEERGNEDVSDEVSSSANRPIYFKFDQMFFKERVPQHTVEQEVPLRDLKEIDYFKAYVDERIVAQITEATNQRHVYENGTSLHLTNEETLVFIGINFALSVIGMPKIRMYWERDTEIEMVAKNMARDRFFKLRSNLKVVDDNAVSEDAKKSDKLWKVRPLLNSIRSRCLELPRPSRVSIDESMIPFRGRSHLKQHVPNKPNPDGLKCFMLAHPNGTVLDFEVFLGKEAMLQHLRDLDVLPERNVGIGEAVVLRFVKSVNEGTSMFFDRYFTSPSLLKELPKYDLKGTGTIKKNLIPKGARMKSDKVMSKLGRGACYNQVSSDKEFVLTQWQDKKVIHMASNEFSIEPQDLCKRWCKKGKKHIMINRPAVVREYNAAMGGVDVHDQLLSYYRSSSKTKKWTVRCILHFLDVAATNSWLEFKNDNPQTKKKFLDFKMSLALQMIFEGYWPMSRSARGQSVSLDSNSSESVDQNDVDETPQRKRNRPSPLPCKEERCSHAKHLPLVLSTNSQYKRCRNTGCSEKCRVMCSSCNIFLCLNAARNCFYNFHSSE